MLAELAPLLYGHNYQVFLRLYRVPFASGEPAEWCIVRALGPSALIRGVAPATGPELLAEVEQSLRYAGDEGSGPDHSVLCSERFRTLVVSLLSELGWTIAEAVLLARFWLRDGHPASPIFWDFAFVIAGPAVALVFIGSSSDRAWQGRRSDAADPAPPR